VFQITDHCPYGNLSDLIKYGDGLPDEAAKLYAGEIVYFIERAHKGEGIIHTSINPKNCLIAKNLHLKIKGFEKSTFYKDKELNVYDADKNF